MSALTPLSPWKLYYSHLVNCNRCIKLKTQLCPVAAVLLRKAKASGEEQPTRRPKRFPFVAKLYERIKVRIEGKWVEAIVVDRSIAAAGRMIGDYRAKTQAVIGYEVETAPKERHYVRPNEIQSLKPKPTFVPKPQVLPLQDFDDGVLTILRRG